MLRSVSSCISNLLDKFYLWTDKSEFILYELHRGGMNKKLEKALNWTVAIVGIIGTLYFTSAKHDDLHETHLNGEETIGIVVKRSTGRSVKPGTGSSKVDYIFKQDGKWIQGTYYGKECYEKAIVGMKYKVKYRPEETKNNVVNHSSVIYIEEPIMSEYLNILQTREWLLNEYYSDITSLKGARDLSEINHMLPDSLRGFWR